MTFFLVGNLGDIFFNLIWFVCLCNIGIWFESRCPRQGREIRNGRVQPVAILFPSPRCPSSISINKFKSFFFPTSSSSSSLSCVCVLKLIQIIVKRIKRPDSLQSSPAAQKENDENLRRISIEFPICGNLERIPNCRGVESRCIDFH